MITSAWICLLIYYLFLTYTYMHTNTNSEIQPAKIVENGKKLARTARGFPPRSGIKHTCRPSVTSSTFRKVIGPTGHCPWGVLLKSRPCSHAQKLNFTTYYPKRGHVIFWKSTPFIQNTESVSIWMVTWTDNNYSVCIKVLYKSPSLYYEAVMQPQDANGYITP